MFSRSCRISNRTRLWRLARRRIDFQRTCVFAGEQIFQQTYPLAAGGSFLLENVNGSVQVEGWDRNEVEVRAVKMTERNEDDVDDVKIDVESDPGQVAVRTRYPQGQSGEVAVEYHVFVPTRVLLTGVGTVNGSVTRERRGW